MKAKAFAGRRGIWIVRILPNKTCDMINFFSFFFFSFTLFSLCFPSSGEGEGEVKIYLGSYFMWKGRKSLFF